MSLADELRDIAKHGWRFNAATILENAAEKLEALQVSPCVRCGNKDARCEDCHGLQPNKPTRDEATFVVKRTGKMVQPILPSNCAPPFTACVIADVVDDVGTPFHQTLVTIGSRTLIVCQGTEEFCKENASMWDAALRELTSIPPILSDDNARARDVGPWGVWNETAGVWVICEEPSRYAYGDRAAAEGAIARLAEVSEHSYVVRPFGGGSSWPERQWRKAVHAISSPHGLKAGELWDRLAEAMGLSRAWRWEYMRDAERDAFDRWMLGCSPKPFDGVKADKLNRKYRDRLIEIARRAAKETSLCGSVPMRIDEEDRRALIAMAGMLEGDQQIGSADELAEAIGLQPVASPVAPDLCTGCGGIPKHTSSHLGRRCCRCNVLVDGQSPADWHVGCVEAAREKASGDAAASVQPPVERWGVWCSTHWAACEIERGDGPKGAKAGDVVGWCNNGLGEGDLRWWETREEAKEFAAAMAKEHGDHYSVHPYTDGYGPDLLGALFCPPQSTEVVICRSQANLEAEMGWLPGWADKIWAASGAKAGQVFVLRALRNGAAKNEEPAKHETPSQFAALRAVWMGEGITPTSENVACWSSKPPPWPDQLVRGAITFVRANWSADEEGVEAPNARLLADMVEHYRECFRSTIANAGVAIENHARAARALRVCDAVFKACADVPQGQAARLPMPGELEGMRAAVRDGLGVR